MTPSLKLMKYYTTNLFPVTSILSESGFTSTCINRLCRINFCTSSSQSEEGEKLKKRKTPRIPQITLIHPNNNMTVSLLEDAQKIAKRHNLQLIKLPHGDAKMQRDTYKLVSSTEYTLQMNNSEESKKHSKSMKLFVINGKINDRDLDIKINNINRLLNRNRMVKIMLHYNSNEEKEVIEKLKTRIQGILQEHRYKDNSIMLVYVPDSNAIDKKENVS